MSCSARGEYDDQGNQMSVNWYQSSILVDSQDMMDDDRVRRVVILARGLQVVSCGF